MERSAFYYRPRRPDDAPLKMRLRELAAARPRFDCRRLHVLLRREGWLMNHKRTYHLYREQGLSVRQKRLSHLRVVPPATCEPNERWRMDFVADSPPTSGGFAS